MIKLNDLLQLNSDELKKTKIKMNQWNGRDNPMDLYQNDPDLINQQWLFWRKKKRYFKVREIAICLLKLSYDTWLLTTIKTVDTDLNIVNGINYLGTEIEHYTKFFGRTIIKYRKTKQSQVYYADSIIEDCEVLEVLPTIFDDDGFPGYEKVRLSFKQLEMIINRRKNDWISSLENQKAVYLITDTKTGRLYVGSAYGDNGMLLNRWESYIRTGHGGNKEFLEIIQLKDVDYIKNNFEYAILENYNSRVDKKIILERESWWKSTLKTRKFGMNSN